MKRIGESFSTDKTFSSLFNNSLVNIVVVFIVTKRKSVSLFAELLY